MRNQGLLLISIALIVLGLVFLGGQVFDLDAGAVCFPAGLILLGAWLLLRPWLVKPEAGLRAILLGDIRYDGTWQLADQEIWLFVGDVNVDVTQAEIPFGETLIRVYGFVSSVRLLVPEGVGVSVSSTAFLTSANVLGRKRDAFFSTARFASDGYEGAERKIRLEPTFFVADVKVRQL
jgi:predicted membrane protein